MQGCRAKFHKEHVSNGEGITPCKVSYDPTTAKEMLLMASTDEEQQVWVTKLHKRIQKSGFKATAAASEGGSSSKVSPQESMRSNMKPLLPSQQQKASTLPAGSTPTAMKK